MNIAKIQEFSDTIREKLLTEVKQRATLFGITSDNISPVDEEFEDSIVINGKVFDKKIKKQRERLIREIEERGYDQVIDEVTYTWFNRFIALKYMEMNEYIPICVVSSKESSKIEPDIIKDALDLSFLKINRDIVLDLKSASKTEELYKYLIFKMCNYLNEIMPFLFEKIDDYTELLFPDKLLHTDSMLNDLNNIIPAEDWNEVEIIGWIYESYIKERKDKVFSNLKKNIKVSKENIPAATAIFTPKWIVKYMVENSLGRLWIESNSNSDLQKKWKYFIDQEMKKPEEKIVDPKEITVLDPAMGSGHILVYAFEVLYEIYKSQGYLENEISANILNKNLYGLEIDDRAAQLAGFALMMKAREYDKDLFKKEIKLHLGSIQETNNSKEIDEGKYPNLSKLWNFYINAKNFGSILKLPEFDLEKIKIEFEEFKKITTLKSFFLIEKIEQLIIQTKIMSKNYDCVVTNPPYMSGGGMNSELSNYVKKIYPNTKSDLFAVFIEKSLEMTKDKKFTSMITMQVWMYLASFENLRKQIIEELFIKSMVHLGTRAFEQIGGEVVSTTAFIIKKCKNVLTKSTYIDLTNYKSSDLKQNEFFEKRNYHQQSTYNFSKIPGCPIAYSLNESIISIFEKNQKLFNVGFVGEGLSTKKNDLFLKMWYEVSSIKFNRSAISHDDAINSEKKFFPFNKGGQYRRWFGNNEFVVNFGNDGRDLRDYKKSQLKNYRYYFKEGFTWTKISSANFNVRLSPSGSIISDAGLGGFIENKNLYYLIGFLNTKIAMKLIILMNPTMNYIAGTIEKLPIIFPSDNTIKQKIDQLTQENIEFSKEEWNSRETSWNFKINPLIYHKNNSKKIDESYNNFCDYWKEKHEQLHKNEKELNKIFIDIYDLNDELTPEVPLEEITILKDETNIKDGELVFKKDVIIKQFLSYAVGCMFGRYNPEKEELIIANQGETLSNFKEKIPNATFLPDEDNIIPVLSDEYFEDDIVTRFKEFLITTFGEEALSENLDFIAHAISNNTRDSSEQIIRKYFINDFYKDHCKMYKKRPIYWFFTSGPNKTFNALIYMHRYNKTTLAKMRTDYLNELQAKLEAKKSTLKLDSNDISEKQRAQQELIKINKMLEESVEYHRLLKNKGDQYIEIDLDDGVKVNYEKFKGLVAEI